jgi:tRNA(Arg) A34 adenosine deaminase TadA
VSVDEAAWAELIPPWQRAFELAWESLRAASIPVGAVVTDASGLIVATGRNRRAEQSGPVGQLAGTALAHAELNALTALTPGVDHRAYTIYTTLEPCLLCTAAVLHTRVGFVRYAAPDPQVHGLRGIPELNQHARDRWPQWDGPLDDEFAVLGGLLPAVWALGAGRDDILRFIPRDVLAGLERLKQVVHDSIECSIADALPRLWPHLRRV